MMIHLLDMADMSEKHCIDSDMQLILFLPFFLLIVQAIEQHHNIMKQVLQHTSKFYHCAKIYRNETLDNAHFFLYTRRNRLEPEDLVVPSKLLFANPRSDKRDKIHHERNVKDVMALSANSRIKSRFFNVRAPTKVVVHGYNESSKHRHVVQIKRAYLARGEFNVILVDWRPLAISPCYSNAAAHAHWVGNRTGELIAGLYSGGTDLDTVHIIGFSLGAQVAGYAGCSISPLKIGRITGLDPALPLFAFVHPNDRLDATDARFVDIIHTNGGALGFASTAGHADFYPNGGYCQPGCKVKDMLCSHGRAPAIYVESVRSRVGFKALSCNSYLDFRAGRCNKSLHMEFLGDPCSSQSRGSYYLDTHGTKPYAIE